MLQCCSCSHCRQQIIVWFLKVLSQRFLPNLITILQRSKDNAAIFQVLEGYFVAADPGLVTLMLDAQLPQIADSMHRSLDAILSAALKAQNSKCCSFNIAFPQPYFCCICFIVRLASICLAYTDTCCTSSQPKVVVFHHSKHGRCCFHCHKLLFATSLSCLC